MALFTIENLSFTYPGQTAPVLWRNFIGSIK